MHIAVGGESVQSKPLSDRIHRGDPNFFNARREVGIEPNFAVVWRVLILVIFVLLTFPGFFGGLEPGLDGSWGTGLNEVSHREMVFGRDIAFTYGPLGFVIVPRFIGSNIIHSIIFRLALHLFWWSSIGILLFRTRGYVASLLLAAACVASGIHFGPAWDANFQLTGVINLAAIGFLVVGLIDRRPIWGIPAAIIAAGAILAKFNVGVACSGAILVWGLIQLRRDPSSRMLGRLALVGITYIAIIMFLFRVYGGPLDALGDFFKYSKEVASGYSAQMSYRGRVSESVAAFAAMGCLLIATVVGLRRRLSYIPVLLVLLLPLFVLFKSAIVRHDKSHIFTSFPVFVGLLAFLLPGQHTRWRGIAIQTIVGAVIVASSWFAPSNIESLLTRGASNWIGLCKYKETVANIQAFDAGIENQLKLPDSFLGRIGSSPMDVYPWDISIASANRLNWQPRFVFQSYSAYTPILDSKSAENFAGRNARTPDYILYFYRSIDWQHPCIVDPLTLMEIYRWYEVVDQADKMLLLKRAEGARWDWDQLELLGTKTLAFDQRWEVPQDFRDQIILRAKLKLNMLGRLLSVLYKVYPPNIRVEYRDGSIRGHRLVWQNVESGFVVSSLPRDLNGVRRFLEAGEADPVRAISFQSAGWCFEREIQLSWSRIELKPGIWPRAGLTASRP